MKNITRGQITIAIIGLIGVVLASGISSWASASRRVADIEREVSVIEEREDNHYKELQKSMDRIEKMISQIINKK